MPTPTSEARVRVTDHCFGVFDGHATPLDTGDWSNGLVRVMQRGCLFFAGIDRGDVGVQALVTGRAPDEVDPGPWDEIIEVSLSSTTGQLHIGDLEHLRTEGLPLLSPAGPGSYRLRVHARGRHAGSDKIEPGTAETYLLTIWPAPPAGEQILRTSVGTGNSGRASAQAPQPAPPPTPDAPDERTERRARNHARLLDAHNRAHPHPDN